MKLAPRAHSSADPPRTRVPVVYAPGYRIRFFGLERLHPFDITKFDRIARLLRREGWLRPADFLRPEPLERDALAGVHDPAYLRSLQDPAVLSSVLELPIPRLLRGLVERRILGPLRLAVAGTLLAARRALAGGGLAINLGGGFHHARPAEGHGFCPYNDVAWAIHGLRRDGFSGRILIVDTDAHQGDGNHAFFADDPTVFSYSVHQGDAFPVPKLPGDLDDAIPAGLPAADHLELVRRRCAQLFEEVAPAFVFHVAGGDVLRDDPLTNLSLTPPDLVERDRIVADAARAAGVPLVHLLAGGYGPSAAGAQGRSVAAMLAAAAGS